MRVPCQWGAVLLCSEVKDMAKKHRYTPKMAEELYDASLAAMTSKEVKVLDAFRKVLRMNLPKNSVNIFMAMLKRCAPRYLHGPFTPTIMTYAQIAKMADVCTITVHKHIDILKAHGLIHINPVHIHKRNILRGAVDHYAYSFTMAKKDIVRFMRKAMKDNDLKDNAFFAVMDNLVREDADTEWPKYADTYAFAKATADKAQAEIADLREGERAFSRPRPGVVSKSLKRMKKHLDLLRSGNFIKTMQLEDEVKDLPIEVAETLTRPLVDADIQNLLVSAIKNCVVSKNNEEYAFPCNREAYRTQSVMQFIYDNSEFTGKPKAVRSWFLYWLGHKPKQAAAAHDAQVCAKVPEWFMDEQWSNEYNNQYAYRSHVAAIVDWYGLRKGRVVYTNSTDLACLEDFLKEVKGWTVNYNQGFLPRPTQRKTSKWMEFISWMNANGSLRLKKKEWAEQNVGV